MTIFEKIVSYINRNKPSRYNLRDIYIAHNGGKNEGFFRPFMFEDNETKIIDMATGMQKNVEDVSYSYKNNIEIALMGMYAEEFGYIEDIQFDRAIKMIDTFVLFPKGKQFRDVRLEMFFDLEEDLIGGSIMEYVQVSAKELSPVINQVRNGVVQHRKNKLEQIKKQKLVVEDLNDKEFGE